MVYYRRYQSTYANYARQRGNSANFIIHANRTANFIDPSGLMDWVSDPHMRDALMNVPNELGQNAMNAVQGGYGAIRDGIGAGYNALQTGAGQAAGVYGDALRNAQEVGGNWANKAREYGSGLYDNARSMMGGVNPQSLGNLQSSPYVQAGELGAASTAATAGTVAGVKAMKNRKARQAAMQLGEEVLDEAPEMMEQVAQPGGMSMRNKLLLGGGATAGLGGAGYLGYNAYQNRQQ